MATATTLEPTIESYSRKYPDVPPEVILKEDLLRLGVMLTDAALEAARKRGDEAIAIAGRIPLARTSTVEVRREPFEAYNAELQSKMTRTVWNTGGCASWYLDAEGRNTTLWPDFTWKFRQRTRRFDAEHYEFGAPATPVAAPTERVEVASS